jgi:hypothetical protein
VGTITKPEILQPGTKSLKTRDFQAKRGQHGGKVEKYGFPLAQQASLLAWVWCILAEWIPYNKLIFHES